MRIRRLTLVWLLGPFAIAVAIAYLERAVAGLPVVPIGLPGGRHTLGLARHWHFASVVFWILNGAAFYVLLFATGQWRRIVPSSARIVPDAWAVFVHYATLHLPPEPDGFYSYNALQQLAYFAAVFVLAPLSILTGPAMSPALVNRFAWYPRLPGNRQIGRAASASRGSSSRTSSRTSSLIGRPGPCSTSPRAS